MVSVRTPVTPTGFRVLAVMLRHRDYGVDDMDRYALAQRARADKSTVHTILRGFIEAGWGTHSRSVDADTGVPHRTVYRLTAAAPSLDEMLGIEAA